MNFDKRTEADRKRIKSIVHIGLSLALLLVILAFNALNDESVVTAVFKAAGYTYGPLLGLYAFGMMTKWQVRDRFVPLICVLSPLICYIINSNSKEWLNGYEFGFEILILNGLLTFIGLMILTRKRVAAPQKV
jgi:hypothetical protein